MSTDTQARIQMAKRHDLTAQQVGHLAADESTEVRRYLAANPVTPPSILRYLLEDTSKKVRRSLYYNPSLPSDIREAALAAGDRHAWLGVPDSQKHRYADVVITVSKSDTDISHAKYALRVHAIEKMGAALGQEDAELIDLW